MLQKSDKIAKPITIDKNPIFYSINPLNQCDLFIMISNLLPEMKEVIKLELLSKYHTNLIRNTNWDKLIKIKSNKHFEHIVKHYKFRNLKVTNNVDVNKYVDYLSNCQTLDFSENHTITNKTVKYLKNCVTLDLSLCHKITDKSIKYLENCINLYLKYCF